MVVVVVDFVAEAEECAAVAFVGGKGSAALTRQGKKHHSGNEDGSAGVAVAVAELVK